MIEAIIYIARKLHWSRREIGELTPEQFDEIIKELQFQESQERYLKDHAVASILAAIYNTIPTRVHKTWRASDFVGPEPQREQGKSLEELAKGKGIQMPQK